MATVVVVGSGVGGLAAAIRLRAAGHRVTVLERNDVVGGKLAGRSVEGFTFDVGPSLLTWPQVFDDLLAEAGTRLADEVRLMPVEPQFHHRWLDGTRLVLGSSAAADEAAVEAWSPGSGHQWARAARRSARVWSVAERTFFAGPMSGPRSLLGRMRSPLDLVTIDGAATLAGRARRSFDDPRLRQWLGRYATYSGSSPYAAPATLSCIPHLERAHGAWHVQGGLARIGPALAAVASRLGVEVRTGVEVERVLTAGPAVTGVAVADGERLAADVVVADVDALHLYGDLLPDARAQAGARRAGRSSSGFVLLLGVAGRTPGLAHHNVAFAADPRREFTQIFEQGRPADDPTIYVCCSAVTDPSMAPAGDENWFVLVNAPSGDLDWLAQADGYRDRVLARMAAHGWDLAGRIRVAETITPADIGQRYRAPGGAIYGTSSNGRRAAFRRPGNRGPRRGLYLVGGSSHPGGGLPLVAISGRIVADLVAEDGW